MTINAAGELTKLRDLTAIFWTGSWQEEFLEKKRFKGFV